MPQDGVVIHAMGNRWFPSPLEVGTRVIEGQSMFLLPDLREMEVYVSVHESMGPRVRVGMKAKVRIASRPGEVIDGRIATMDMLSNPNWKEWDENVRHFIATVQLDHTPPSALVFMSVTVEIDTSLISDALRIPVEAVDVVDGHDTCYVVDDDDGLTRRAIKTRRATPDLLEVTAGLREGERIVSRSFDVGDDIAVVDKTHDPIEDIASPGKQDPSRSGMADRLNESRAVPESRKPT